MSLMKLIRQNIREYGMYIALVDYHANVLDYDERLVHVLA